MIILFFDYVILDILRIIVGQKKYWAVETAFAVIEVVTILNMSVNDAYSCSNMQFYCKTLGAGT